MREEEVIKLKYEQLEIKIAIANGEKCDKYDYLIAVFCGVACGLIDSFLVGKPNFRNDINSKLGSITDNTANELTSSIADLMIKKDEKILKDLKRTGLKGDELSKALMEKGVPGNFKRSEPRYENLKGNNSKITYLEEKFKVCYDQSTNDKIIGDNVNITPDNHHLKNLAHYPDIIGLFFAILDQFTIKSSFVENGKIIRVVPTKAGPVLQGSDLITKLYCAVCNWLGHLLSDFCGSHSSKGRGDGIPIPFFEIFQFCDFGDFVYGDGTHYTFAQLACEVYESGYDARHGMALAVPVILNDLMIRLIWALKKHFYEKRPWKDCIPLDKKADLRIMLIYGNLSLCVVDGIDAVAKTGGELLELCLHLNIIAWLRLAKRVWKELELRGGFTYEDLKVQYEFLELQLQKYTNDLINVDYDSFDKKLSDEKSIKTDNLEEIDQHLDKYIKSNGIELQYKSADEFEALVLDDSKSLKL